jgi:hypothetical protein
VVVAADGIMILMVLIRMVDVVLELDLQMVERHLNLVPTREYLDLCLLNLEQMVQREMILVQTVKAVVAAVLKVQVAAAVMVVPE